MIRPSNLPKLSICPQFEGSETPSAAAARGTRIDGIFRELLERRKPETDNLDEFEAAHWAAEYVRNRCGVEEVFALEADCKVGTTIQGLSITGTMDAMCPDMHLLFDLKTGEIRDYRAQMAAYCLACMEENGVSEWTAVLIFADKREIREHRFRHWEAQGYVSEIVGRRIREIPQAVACDYCGWCAKQDSCHTLHDAGNRALGLVAEPDRFGRILENPTSLGFFLESATVVERWIEQAREKAKAMMLEGVEVPGWRLQERKGRASVDVQKLMADPGCDVSKILPAKVSEKTAREALPSLADSLIERGENVFALVQDRSKTLKGK